jgi:hypothetical protein
MNKTKAIIVITVLLSILFVSCKKDIYGKWEISDMKVVESKNEIPQIMIDNAKTIALATSYEFFSDGKFTMTTTCNDVTTVGFKNKGRMTIGNNQLILQTDTLFSIQNAGDDWRLVERNDYNAETFDKPEKMKIKKLTSNQMILSQSDNYNNIIHYTLSRANR